MLRRAWSRTLLPLLLRREKKVVNAYSRHAHRLLPLKRERELLLHRSKTTNVHETSSKFFINMCAAFRACCMKSARDNRTLRNSGETAAQKRIEERERESAIASKLFPRFSKQAKRDDDSTFRNVPSGSILVVRANYWTGRGSNPISYHN